MSIEKEVCRSCLMGKQTRKLFPQATQFQATKKIQLIHGDLCGAITPARKQYTFVLIDDYSRYMWSILIKDKSEAFAKFKKLRSIIEQQTRDKIQVFRTDVGGEFVSNEFNTYCENSGLKRHLTAPYTPQQNYVVERRNRTLQEMTRSKIKHMDMPNYFQGEAVRHTFCP